MLEPLLNLSMPNKPFFRSTILWTILPSAFVGYPEIALDAHNVNDTLAISAFTFPLAVQNDTVTSSRTDSLSTPTARRRLSRHWADGRDQQSGT